MSAEFPGKDHELLQKALDAAGVGVWQWDVIRNRIHWSEAVYRHFGVARGSFGGTLEEYVALIHPEDRPRVAALIQGALERREKDFGLEHRVLRPDGSVAWLEGRGEVECDASGKPWSMRGTVVEITARKRDEHFRDSIIRRAAEGLCVCHDIPEEPFVRFTVWNDRMVEITGHTMEEINAKGWYQSLYPNAEVRQRAIDRMNQMREGKDLRGEEWDIVRADGQPRVIRISTSVLHHESGQTHVLGIMEDATEKRRLQEQLFQVQKVESIGRLAGGVAHDFNNLLTTVLGFAEIAQQKVPADSPAFAALTYISEAAQRGAALTRQLLLFARRQKTDPVPVDLAELLRRLEPLLRRLIGEDVDLLCLLPAEPVVVRADPGQFEQVIVNLVVNARDAMPRGGKLTLELLAEDVGLGSRLGREGLAPGSWAVLGVSDNGSGMPPEVKARLFEPFFTTKPVGRGTGLGLATCYGIVAQAGGRILVESEPGRGSRFRVCLPRITGKAKGDTAVLPRIERGDETLLFVEDDALIRTMVRELLAGQGYRVLEAPSGEAALQALERHTGEIDLLVTDVVMPGMGGRELWERLKKRRPRLQVLFTSGYTEDLTIQGPGREEGRSFLPKPYTPHELLARIRSLLPARKR